LKNGKGEAGMCTVAQRGRGREGGREGSFVCGA
jgi:hypothetical protein